MAKASWCNVSPMSGSENGTLTISAAAHAGREARSTTVTVMAKNGTKPSASIAVSQAGVGVQLTMDTSKPDLPGEGGSVTINGNSNSPTLKISVPLINFPGVTASAKFNAPGITDKVLAASETVTIPGDPGASGRFNFVATLTFPASMFPVDAVVTFRLTDDTNSAKQCTFTWKAGASSLSVNKSSLSLVNGGTGQTVNVTSNDDWNVS